MKMYHRYLWQLTQVDRLSPVEGVYANDHIPPGSTLRVTSFYDP